MKFVRIGNVLVNLEQVTVVDWHDGKLTISTSRGHNYHHDDNYGEKFKYLCFRLGIEPKEV